MSLSGARSLLGLSLFEKANLILALSLAPLAIVGLSAVADQQRHISDVDQERAGMRYLQTLELVRSSHDENPDDAVDALDQAEASFGGTMDDAVQFDRLRALLKAPSPNRDAAVSAAIEQLRAHIIQKSGLDRDPSYAAVLTRTALPAVERSLDGVNAAMAARGNGGRAASLARVQMLEAIGAAKEALLPLMANASAASVNAGDEDVRARASGFVSVLSTGLADIDADLAKGRWAADKWRTDLRLAEARLLSLQDATQAALDSGLAAEQAQFGDAKLATLFWLLLIAATALSAGVLAMRVWVSAPLSRLVEATGSLIDGDLDQEIPLQNRDDEIGGIARFLEMFREFAHSRMAAEIARNSAETASLAKSQFIANMSHELRTPLNAIIGYSEIVLEDLGAEAASSDSVKDLERILAAAKHLLGLINDILDLSKVEAGRMTLLADDADIGALVSEVAATVAPAANKNGTRIIVETENAPSSFRTDALKLRQCILNLASNAAKFTKNGVVRLSVEPFEADGEPALRFVVADTGIGISREQQKRLFQAFAQADDSITREYGGTGLGLMLTKRLAHLLGGDVSVKSEVGAGSIFSFWIREQRLADELQAIGPPPTDAPLIVVIDDEKETHELCCAALTPLGFAVQGAPSAAQGLDFVRAHAPRIAAVILDLNLPDRRGWSLLSELQSVTETETAPIIVLSVDDDKQTSASLGAAAHLIKPAQSGALASTVLRLARLRPSPAHTMADDAPSFAIAG
jgi:signal transduction histidine kinase/ActR/RegA family two-component response regulator